MHEFRNNYGSNKHNNNEDVVKQNSNYHKICMNSYCLECFMRWRA